MVHDSTTLRGLQLCGPLHVLMSANKPPALVTRGIHGAAHGENRNRDKYVKHPASACGGGYFFLHAAAAATLIAEAPARGGT